MTRPMLSRIYGFTLSLLRLIRHLPGFAPFVPLVWRAAFSSTTALPVAAEVPGALTPAEREWLAAQVRRTRAEATIVQMGPPQADVTCALAAGCWASRRRVYVLWPEAAVGVRLREWHRTIIRQGFAPYVTPVVGQAAWSGPADLLYAQSAEGWADGLKPGSVVVRRRSPGSPKPLPGQLDACGGLVALRPTSP